MAILSCQEHGPKQSSNDFMRRRDSSSTSATSQPRKDTYIRKSGECDLGRKSAGQSTGLIESIYNAGSSSIIERSAFA